MARRLQIRMRDTHAPADAPLVEIPDGGGGPYRAGCESERYACPVPGCPNPLLIMKAGTRVRHHVAHRSAVEHDPETLLHLDAKDMVAAVARRSHGDAAVRLEAHLPQINRRADVLVTCGALQCALEVQVSPFADGNLSARIEDYQKVGTSIWFWVLGGYHATAVTSGGPRASRCVDLSREATIRLIEDGAVVIADPDGARVGFVFYQWTSTSAPRGVARATRGRTRVDPLWIPADELTCDARMHFVHPLLEDARRRTRDEARRRRALQSAPRTARRMRGSSDDVRALPTLVLARERERWCADDHVRLRRSVRAEERALDPKIPQGLRKRIGDALATLTLDELQALRAEVTAMAPAAFIMWVAEQVMAVRRSPMELPQLIRTIFRLGYGEGRIHGARVVDRTLTVPCRFDGVAPAVRAALTALARVGVVSSYATLSSGRHLPGPRPANVIDERPVAWVEDVAADRARAAQVSQMWRDSEERARARSRERRTGAGPGQPHGDDAHMAEGWMRWAQERGIEGVDAATRSIIIQDERLLACSGTPRRLSAPLTDAQRRQALAAAGAAARRLRPSSIR